MNRNVCLIFPYNLIFIISFIFKLNAIICQIYDNFTNKILDENSQFIDVHDYHNLKLVVTTSKKIFTGIPPILKTTTGANLISSSSAITLNSNYILVSCLKDSLLTKININNGNFSSLLNYSDSQLSDLNLEIPITSCHLSNIGNTIFIGYTRIDYYENEINKTNIIIRLNITNVDSDNGPDINPASSIKSFIFPKSGIKANSTRHIGCQPLRLTFDINNYRLICFQSIFELNLDENKYRFHIYALSLNKSLNGFEHQKLIFKTDYDTGIKVYKLNDTYVKCMLKKNMFDICVNKGDNYPIITSKETDYINGFNANLDLFDYSNGLVVTSEKANFAGKNNIFLFKISKITLKNLFKLYDYKESEILQLFCYYDETNDYIFVLYQSLETIKYYIMHNSKKLYEINGGDYIHKTLKVKSYEERFYNISEMTDITKYGSLNVLIKGNYKNNTNNKNETFGIDFNNTLISDNRIFVNKTRNLWYDYYLTFIEHVENNYTRIYNISNFINFRLRTCSPTRCGSCRNNYSICDDCIYENYALIKNGNRTCYPKDKNIKSYIFNNKSNLFEKCYSSCDFCSSLSTNNSDHKCLSCSNGYLTSYKNLGNCYISSDTNFITSSCSKYIINSTNECIDECPTTSPYYSFDYKSEIENYEKTSLKPPKYLFNKKCYDECPTNSVSKNDNNICEISCQFSFYIDNNNKIECYNDNDCSAEHPYHNPETRECFSSLDDCFNKENNYFFNKECYKNTCINNKTSLKSQSTDIKNFIKNKLELNDNLLDNICICNIKNGVWTNINSNGESYFQECLSECPQGYEPENITHYCVEKKEDPTTEIITIPTQSPTTEIITIPTQSPTTEIITIPTQSPTTEITTIPIHTTTTEVTTMSTQPLITEITNIPKQQPITEITTITSIPTQIPTTEINNISTQSPITEITIIPTQTHTTEFASISIQRPTNEIITTPIQTTASEDTNVSTQTTTNEITTINTQKSSNEITNILIQSSTNEKFEISTDINIYSSNTEIINIKTDISNITGIITANSDLFNLNESSIQTISNSDIYSTEQNIISNIPSTKDNIFPYSESILTSDKPFIMTESFNSEVKSNNDEVFSSQSIINQESEKKYPEEYYKDSDNCLVLYNNKCYSSCPKGTCISQKDSELKNCISIEINMTVFNDICFENMDKIITNIKNMSDNNEEISTGNGIIIHAYSTNSENIDIPKEKNYSVLYLGDCEGLLRIHYNLSENTDLYILGIDSPNKNKNSSTNVFNYGVFLENGTQLDHISVCKNEKVIISSLIVNVEKIKYENASYFSDFGYDIYDENNSFYTDKCSGAYIDNNDITLTDRKKYYYPENISLCNESCQYVGVDFDTQRFTCECEISYNYSLENSNDDNNNEEEEITYLQYLMSFVNYKIILCYNLLLNIKNYKSNVGFYISVAILLFCLVQMLLYLVLGLKDMKIKIMENIPNYLKRINALKNQIRKEKDLINLTKDKNVNNPIKYKKNQKLNIFNLNKAGNKNNSKNISVQTGSKESQLELKNKSLGSLLKIKRKKKSNLKKGNNNGNTEKTTDIKLLLFISKTEKQKSKKRILKKNSRIKTKKGKSNKNKYLSFKNGVKFDLKRGQNKSITEIYGFVNYNIDNQVDSKEINRVPFSQALRIDKRDYCQMFMSFLAKEIDIINIFYYRNPYDHITISLSLYAFESCVDLTFNCFLCTDEVVSQKYHNKGSLKLLTSLTISLLSNIISSLIVFLIEKIVDYGDKLEYIVKEIYKKSNYFYTYLIFKKYLAIKLVFFFILETLFNIFMCYFLTIFCSIYYKIQKSIIINYILGMCQSMVFSLSIAIFSSFIRFLSSRTRQYGSAASLAYQPSGVK